MKRIIQLCLSAVFALAGLAGLAGCGTDPKKVVWPEDVTVVSAITAQSFTESTQWGKNPVSLAITEKTKVAFDVEYVSGTSFAERMGTLLAGGDLPEVIFDCDNNTLVSLLEADMIYDLEPYLQNSGEHIKQVFAPADLDAIRYIDAEGNKGGVYGFNSSYGARPANADWYIQVQYRLLEEFGYPVIRDLNHLGEMIEEYMRRHPKDAAGRDNIGIMVPLKDASVSQNVGNAAMRLGGHQNDGEFYIDPTTLDVSYTLTANETKQYTEWLWSMRTKGLMPVDCFNFDYSAIRTISAMGDVLCVVEPDWQFSEAEQVLLSEGKYDRRYAKLPIYLDGVDASKSYVANFDSRGSWKAVITKSCQDPQKVFDFFDYLWSEEGQIYQHWGVEGVHYDVVEGKRVLREAVVQSYLTNPDFKTQTGIDLYGFWSQGEGSLDSTGQHIRPFAGPEMIAAKYTAKDKEVIGIYAEKLGKPNAVTWQGLWPEGKQSPWGFAWKWALPTSGDARPAYQAASMLKNGKASEKICGAINASTKTDFDRLWSEWESYAYSNKIINTASDGVAGRERHVTTALMARMNDMYPNLMQSWQITPFNWMDVDLATAN